MASKSSDIPQQIADLRTRLDAAMQERDSLRRVQRSREDVIAEADASITAAGTRAQKLLGAKLNSRSAPYGPALRPLTGPDADLLTYLLQDRLRDALRECAPPFRAPPADRDRRLVQLEADIAAIHRELDLIRTATEAHV